MDLWTGTNTSTAWFAVPTDGTPAGDYIVINDHLYISMNIGTDNVHLLRVGLNLSLEWDNTYTDLGRLPSGLYNGLSNIGSELYAIDGNDIIKVDRQNIANSTSVFTSVLASNYIGAASVEDGIVTC